MSGPARTIAAAFLLGVVARGWMRLISDDPEFTWGGTIAIVLGFTFFGLAQAVAALGRGWRPWPRRAARLVGVVGLVPLLGAAGGPMLPTIVGGGFAAWRPGWPRLARAACALLAALPVAFAASTVVDDFGWSLRSLAGIVGLVGVYGAIVWLAGPTFAPRRATSRQTTAA